MNCEKCGQPVAKRSGETFAAAIERGLIATAERRVAKSDGETTYTEELEATMNTPEALNAFQTAGFAEARRLSTYDAYQALTKRFAGNDAWLRAIRDAYVIASR